MLGLEDFVGGEQLEKIFENFGILDGWLGMGRDFNLFSVCFGLKINLGLCYYWLFRLWSLAR